MWKQSWLITLFCAMNAQVLYLFAERDHNHIVIGNLKTITTNKVHKRFSKGPEYWGNRTSDYEKANESVVAGIKSYF